MVSEPISSSSSASSSSSSSSNANCDGNIDATNDYGENIDTAAFNCKLESIVDSYNGEQSAREAENLLLSVLQKIDENDTDNNIIPNAMSVNLVMRAWAMVEKKYAATRAEELLRMQTERSKLPGQEMMAPTVYSFSAVINAYANIGRPDKAEAVLRFQVEEYEAGNERARPNRVVFNTIIKAWSMSRMKGREKRAEEILRHMLKSCEQDPRCPKPDKITFNIVLGTYAKSSVWGSSRKALRLLEEMEELNKKPEWRTKPDAITHLLVIQALGKERTLNASEMALGLLHKLQRQFKETGDDAFKPNKIHYNAVINGFANCKLRPDVSNAERAEAVLKEMHELYNNNQYSFKPDRISYSSTITGYANEGRPLDAERVLGMMIEEYKNGDTRCKPDAIAYTSVINAWAQSGEKGAAQRATEFLHQMEVLSSEHDEDIKPTKITYGCVINAWANSGESHSGEKAEEILNRMEQLYEAGDEEVRPDVSALLCRPD